MDSLIVFDMDGVLTEVSESYREAIVQTVESFTGQRITRDLIQQYKNRGGWNNDWALSKQIAADLGFDLAYDNVVNRFNQLFLGKNGDGLITRERWFPQPGLLERLNERSGLAIFTGRLRYEADISLRRFANGLRFDPIICADNVTAGKPAPDGLHAIQRMKPASKLVYVGDTVDDARSASAAGVPFIGIAAENHSRRADLIGLFEQERAIAILENISEIESVV
ncbi:MAG TPA: HAD-IA family hydrolase [Bryobacteraceae bacterium]|nr:HAD-IA family hydrolase [Bryobacteraceae bacterium]